MVFLFETGHAPHPYGARLPLVGLLPLFPPILSNCLEVDTYYSDIKYSESRTCFILTVNNAIVKQYIRNTEQDEFTIDIRSFKCQVT